MQFTIVRLLLCFFSSRIGKDTLIKIEAGIEELRHDSIKLLTTLGISEIAYLAATFVSVSDI